MRTALSSNDSSKLALVLEYDGSRYHGFQVQRQRPTIQDELESALARIIGQRVRVTVAGRTDAGVHAIGQVVSFPRLGRNLSLREWRQALNFYLPTDVAVVEARSVPAAFDARRSAVSRIYSYRIVNRQVRSPVRDRYSYHVPHNLDIEAMALATRPLLGRHDFSAFAASGFTGASAVRTVIRADWCRQGDELRFEIEANGFLLRQVRLTVGTLLRVGLGKLEPEAVGQLLDSRKPGLAGPAVPAKGLFLTAVTYPEPYEFLNMIGRSDFFSE